MGPLLVFQAEVAGMLTDDSGNRELEEMHKQASSAIASRQVVGLFCLFSRSLLTGFKCYRLSSGPLLPCVTCVCVSVYVCVCVPVCVRAFARAWCMRIVRCGAGMAEKRG